MNVRGWRGRGEEERGDGVKNKKKWTYILSLLPGTVIGRATKALNYMGTHMSHMTYICNVCRMYYVHVDYYVCSMCTCHVHTYIIFIYILLVRTIHTLIH